MQELEEKLRVLALRAMAEAAQMTPEEKFRRISDNLQRLEELSRAWAADELAAKAENDPDLQTLARALPLLERETFLVRMYLTVALMKIAWWLGYKRGKAEGLFSNERQAPASAD